MTISVLLADDAAMARTGFTALLDAQPDVRVVGQATTGKEAVAKAVRVVVAGDALLSPGITRRVIEQFASRRPRPPRDAAGGTPPLDLQAQGDVAHQPVGEHAFGAAEVSGAVTSSGRRALASSRSGPPSRGRPRRRPGSVRAGAGTE